MEKKLGLAYDTIKRKIDIVVKEVYDRDLVRLETYKYLERRQSVYIIFAEVPNDKLPTTFYIGKTSQTIQKRFKNHMSEIRSMIKGDKEWKGKYVWMSQVIHGGGNLIIYELNKVQKSVIYKYEQEWITYLKRCGFKLLNKVNSKYYNKKTLKL